MPREPGKILEIAQVVFATENQELAAVRARQMLAVITKAATGVGDIDTTFGLDLKFRLVAIRCHFVGNPGTAAFAISLDSSRGSAYDTRLFTITQAGTGKDVNLRISGSDNRDPSPWTFQAGDRVRVEWANPDAGNITWGLEVGLALAS